MDHETVLVNELRLGDFKQVLTKAGITAEFSAGILWCCNGTIALRKVGIVFLSFFFILSSFFFLSFFLNAMVL